MKTTAIEENGTETLEQLIALARAKNENEINGISVHEPVSPAEAAAPKTPYRLYPNMPVTLNYQNMGSVWLLIMRGKKADIEQVFNGLSNLGATSTPEPRYHSNDCDTATCWSSPKEMRAFFDLRHELRTDMKSKIRTDAEMKKFREHSEVFMDYHNINMGESPEVYDILKMSAENPDNDFRDAMWTVEARGLLAPL